MLVSMDTCVTRPECHMESTAEISPTAESATQASNSRELPQKTENNHFI